MKKTVLTLITLFTLSSIVFGKEIPVQGQWILTTFEAEGNTQDIYSEVEFVADGTLRMQDMDIGKWLYDAKTKMVTIESERVKEFVGTRNVNVTSKTSMTLESGGARLNFIKYDETKIGEANQKSGLLGVWTIKSEMGDKYLVFKEPNTLVINDYSAEYSSTAHGLWIYDKGENSVIFLVNDRALKGLKPLKIKETNQFVIENNGEEMSFNRVLQNGKEKESLDFTGEDIALYNDNKPEYAAPEEEKLPWKGSESFMSYFQNVKSLTYQKSAVLPEVDIFITSDVVANVSVDFDNQEVQIDEIFEGLMSDEMDGNYFFPIEVEGYFKVVGEKEITVPAGTFNCVVIETTDFLSDGKLRLYMVKNRPGVYAKIVRITNNFDEENYSAYELAKIDGDFTAQDNSQIIGNWLLVKTGNKPTSKGFEFINDGRIAITEFDYTSYLNWNYDKESNTVQLISDGEQNDFEVVKITESEMFLKQGDVTQMFVKFDLSTGHDANQKSGLAGYWILTNTTDEYQTMYLNDGDSILGFDYNLKSPITQNDFEYQGKWLFNEENSTLILNVPDEQRNIRGTFDVTKKTDNVLVLNNGNNQLVYFRLDPEKVAKNNAESGLEGGIWKITKPDGSSVYFEFKSAFEFYYGRESKDEMMHLGTWMYNPDTQMLFVGAQVHYINGEHKIVKSTNSTIEFNNTMKLEKVK